MEVCGKVACLILDAICWVLKRICCMFVHIKNVFQDYYNPSSKSDCRPVNSNAIWRIAFKLITINLGSMML